MSPQAALWLLRRLQQDAIGNRRSPTLSDGEVPEQRLIIPHDEEFDRLIVKHLGLLHDVRQIGGRCGFPLVQADQNVARSNTLSSGRTAGANGHDFQATLELARAPLEFLRRNLDQLHPEPAPGKIENG